jgi:hypothetical protein
VQQVPEPSTILLFLTAITMWAGWWRMAGHGRPGDGH